MGVLPPSWLAQREDEFGLPTHPPSLLGDTPADVAQREKAAGAAARQLFAALVMNLGGGDGTQALGRHGQGRKGRPSRPIRPDKDAELLDIYDSCLRLQGAPEPDMPRRISEWADRTQPGAFGATPDAIQKHLRTLLRDRRESERKQVEFNRIMFGKDHPPPSLLSSASQQPPSSRSDSDDAPG